MSEEAKETKRLKSATEKLKQEGKLQDAEAMAKLRRRAITMQSFAIANRGGGSLQEISDWQKIIREKLIRDLEQGEQDYFFTGDPKYLATSIKLTGQPHYYRDLKNETDAALALIPEDTYRNKFKRAEIKEEMQEKLDVYASRPSYLLKFDQKELIKAKKFAEIEEKEEKQSKQEQRTQEREMMQRTFANVRGFNFRSLFPQYFDNEDNDN